MKVYVVTQGEYSDYRIVAIFSTREQAELKCATLYDDYNEIAEWEVDAETLQGEATLAYMITYSTNTGEIICVSGPRYVIKGSISKNQEFCFSGNHIPAKYEYEVEAETEDQARKIFQDRYAQAKYEYLMDELDKVKKRLPDD